MTGAINTISEQFLGRCLLPLYETHLRGRNTFRYRAEFEANQWRSAEEIAVLQWQRLGVLLSHAYRTVPFYRRWFDQLGARPEDIRTASDFARLPTLDKATIRQNRSGMISTAFDSKTLIASATGGSTGEPL